MDKKGGKFQKFSKPGYNNNNQKSFDKKRKAPEQNGKKDFKSKDFNKKPKLTNQNNANKSKTFTKTEDSSFTPKEKFQKPVNETVQSAKIIWEKVRQKTISKQERAPMLDELIKLVKGKVHDFIFKHDASRIVQTCLKHGNKPQREMIMAELKGHYIALVKSQYGHHLVLKMLKYLRSKSEEITKEFTGQYPKLVKHKQASPVIDYLYTSICNSVQRSHILLEFYGPEFAVFKSNEKKTIADVLNAEPHKKKQILKYLAENLTVILTKGSPIITFSIVHQLLLDYFSHADAAGISDMIAGLREHIPEILHTREGAKVAVLCVAYGSAKDRKIMIKAMKGLVAKACAEEYGHLVILRLLYSVDDTLLINKAILGEVIKSIDKLLMDRYGRSVLMFILAPNNSKYFSAATVQMLQPVYIPKSKGGEDKDEEDNEDEEPAKEGAMDTEQEMISTSKKPIEQKQVEYLNFISDPLVTYVAEHIENFLYSKEGSQLLYETCRMAKCDKTVLFKKISDAVDKDSQQYSEEPAPESENVMQNIFTNRVLKSLIKEDESFAKAVVDSIKNKEKWATSKGASFVIVALLESPATSAQVIKELKPHAKKFAKSTDDAGTKIVSQLLSKSK